MQCGTVMAAMEAGSSPYWQGKNPSGPATPSVSTTTLGEIGYLTRIDEVQVVDDGSIGVHRLDNRRGRLARARPVEGLTPGDVVIDLLDPLRVSLHSLVD